ncbi:MAG: B12-binding domain-containing radical SAM protein [Pseudonocardiales bacterium]
MPPVRTVIPLSPPVRVLLYAPTLHESGFKQRHIDGEALVLYAYLKATHHDCVLLDAYYRGRPAPDFATVLTEGPSFDAVVVHLWTSDAYGPRLRQIANELAMARLTYDVPVIGFGPLATSAQHELRDHGAIDHAVGLAPATAPVPLHIPVARLIGDMGAHLTRHTPLTGLTSSDVPYPPDAVVSVSASRGCRSRCTFCAYNADLGGGWHELSVAAAVADLAHLHRLTGATRFAFADTDFGGTLDACHRRARALRDTLAAQGLIGTVTLAINIRSETLTPDTVTELAEAGVRTMLLGVESFNDTTLRRLYGKRQDLDHLHRIVSAADACGVTTVASYILWHPWQSIDSLRGELASIDAFGRHRIAQFMARSRLLVIPGTAIEQRIRQAGLLDAAPFHRRFRFADRAAAELHDALVHRFETTTAPALARLSEERHGDLAMLARLKIDEWQWLTDAAGLGINAPRPQF